MQGIEICKENKEIFMAIEVIFYPVGNGDCSQIILEDKRLLFDFYHQKQGEDEENEIIDLSERLRDELKEEDRDFFDVVAFTHADEDHISGASDFFELKHASKYQGDGRIKIQELWVPVAMILEQSPGSEAKPLRQEARHRLKEGKGVKVFSKPEKLKDWLEENGLTLEEREHLIVNAGELIEGFSLDSEGVEFFVHSPFVASTDEGDEKQRNESALVLHATFEVDGTKTTYMMFGDTECSELEKIVEITQNKGNEERLLWDLFNIPHHCSHNALNTEKGEKETEPLEKIKDLLDQAQNGSYMISSSRPINNDNEAYEQKLPPHIQAYNCYKKYLEKNGGRKILVTMEEPNKNKPAPIVFSIDGSGVTLKDSQKKIPYTSPGSKTPRAGMKR